MSRMGRRDEVTVNRVGPFRCAAILVAVLGGLLATPPAPARADTFPRTLSVDGRVDMVTVLKGNRVRLEWNFPAATPGFAPHWVIGVGTRPITCEEDIASIVRDARTSHPGTWFLPNSLERSGSVELDTSGAEWPTNASYYVRGCLRLDRGRHHGTNQVEIRLATAVSGPIVARPPGSPQITSAITPVRPGYMIGVFGRDFGERPGRLLLRIGGAEYRLNVSDGDWHSRGIAGRIPRIVGVPDGPASLIVERASGARSISSRMVNFVATREVRLVPGGQVHVDSCSDDPDDCHSATFPGAPSFEAQHDSFFVISAAGERGIDQFSIALANGWRFHELQYSIGNRPMPPRWTTRDRETDHPRIQVTWSNPGGFDVRIIYGFDLYIVGPMGVPHR